MSTTTQALAKTLTVCALVCMLLTPCAAQKANGTKAVPKNHDAYPLLAEGEALLARVRALPHPATRAFLYPQVAALLWERVGADDDLRRAALDATTAGLEDLQKNEEQIPRASITFFYTDLIRTVRQYDAAEAERLEQSFPLAAVPSAGEQERAGASLYAALARYEKGTPQSAQSLNEALEVLGSGKVPGPALIGELLWLDKSQSPALPSVLAATVSLMERQADSLSFMTMFYVAHVYLNDSTPPDLRPRFLTAALASVTARADELRINPQGFSWATQLLQYILPSMQSLTPSLHPQAAALLASLAPNLLQTDTAWDRVKASADPFEQTLTEADHTSDARLKRQLLESAARLAQDRGDLRRAVDLMVAEEEEGGRLPEGYSYHEEFLDEVVQAALNAKEIETANYAVSKMSLPLYRVEALRKVAGHHTEAGDIQRAATALEEALKALRDAPDGDGKAAAAYLRLSTDFLKVDRPRTFELIRIAAKSVDAIKRPDKDERGEFGRKLYPLLDETVSTFRQLARDDRAGALSAAAFFVTKEFGVAAAVGVSGR